MYAKVVMTCQVVPQLYFWTDADRHPICILSTSVLTTTSKVML